MRAANKVVGRISGRGSREDRPTDDPKGPQLRRDAQHALATREQETLERPGHVAAVLDRPHPLGAHTPSPAQQVLKRAAPGPHRPSATLLSSQAEDPRAAASDTTRAGQTEGRHESNEPARRRPELHRHIRTTPAGNPTLTLRKRQRHTIHQGVSRADRRRSLSPRSPRGLLQDERAIQLDAGVTRARCRRTMIADPVRSQ